MAETGRKIPKGIEYSKNEIIIKLIRQAYNQVDEIRNLKQEINSLKKLWQEQKESHKD